MHIALLSFRIAGLDGVLLEWERKRYLQPTWSSFFRRYFPPPINPLISHVTLSSIAQKNLKQRTRISSVIIGDSFDFNNDSLRVNHYSDQWRADFNIKPKDLVFLQATRIVPRKQVELSIELIKKLNNSQIVFVAAGQVGDEGEEYLGYLKYLAKQAGIRVRFIGNRIGARREIRESQRTYTLWDCFINCDFVTYPSQREGFGNQFIEAIYFKKPIIINLYPVYKADLEPLGFNAIAIDGKITGETIQKIKKIMKSPQRQEKMAENNLKIAKRRFSYEATQKKLVQLGF